MLRDDWIVVEPGAQGLEALRAELTALADHPGHVRTAGGAYEFLVPPYLAERYTTPPAPKRRRTKKEEGDE